MLIPLLSVSAIGLWAGLRHPSRAAGTGPVVGAGLVGAWAGYLAGWFGGSIVDVIIFGSFWSTLIGHIAAFGLARVAAGNRARAAVTG